MMTTATDKGDHYVVNGSKMFISAGRVSDLLFVLMKTGKREVSCFVIDSKSEGVSFG